MTPPAKLRARRAAGRQSGLNNTGFGTSKLLGQMTKEVRLQAEAKPPCGSETAQPTDGLAFLSLVPVSSHLRFRPLAHPVTS